MQLSSGHFTRREQLAERTLCNKIVKHIQEYPTVGLTLKSVLAWPSEAEAPTQVCITAVPDVWCGIEDVYLDEFGVREAFRCQGDRVVFLVTKDLCEKPDGRGHMIAYGSVVQERVVNSTIKAKTHQLSDVVEATGLPRACIAWTTRSGRLLPHVS